MWFDKDFRFVFYKLKRPFYDSTNANTIYNHSKIIKSKIVNGISICDYWLWSIGSPVSRDSLFTSARSSSSLVSAEIFFTEVRKSLQITM